jgi:hypothetical protein
MPSTILVSGVVPSRDRQFYCVDFCAGTNRDFDAVANPRFGEGFCQDSSACVLASVDFEKAVALVQTQFFRLRKNWLERCTARVGSDEGDAHFLSAPDVLAESQLIEERPREQDRQYSVTATPEMMVFGSAVWLASA